MEKPFSDVYTKASKTLGFFHQILIYQFVSKPCSNVCTKANKALGFLRQNRNIFQSKNKLINILLN